MHIPWCRQACLYCDFHFRASWRDKIPVLHAISRELTVRAEESGPVETLYFGGGTPSMLTPDELENLMQTLNTCYSIQPGAEITLEANPDDLNFSYLKALRSMGINRLSIGVQSFSDPVLQWMNRRHDAFQASRAVLHAAEAGFDNLNIDLIYGVPGLSTKDWEKSLEIALALPIQHLSAYHLTIEENTPLGVFHKRGRVSPVPESLSEAHFQSLLSITAGKGFEHYEISNFALKGHESRHNTAYWEQKSYLGIGPSAHSYNGTTRRWNLSLNGEYARRVEQGIPWWEEETLTSDNRYNEYLMTSLRTRKGMDSAYLLRCFGADRYRYFLKNLDPWLETGKVEKNGETGFRISHSGLLLTDRIVADLFFTE